jgi:hypothetical protein
MSDKFPDDAPLPGQTDHTDTPLADPRLAGLLGRLTADPTPGELAGESAALAMFRARAQPGAQPETSRPVTDIAAASGSGRSSGSGPTGRRGRRGRWLAAAAVVVIGGFGGAAYAAILPAPVQHVAFRVLGFAGVADSRSAATPVGRRPVGGPSSRSAGTSRTSPPAAASTSPATAPPRTSGSATPPGSGPVQLTLTASSSQIVAGASEEFDGRLSRPASGQAGVTVRLAERLAGQPGWQLAASARTQSGGSAVLTVPHLTANAVFRLIGPDGARSAPVRVTVVPAVAVSVSPGPAGRTALLTVSAPLAAPGNPVVLQVRSGAGWLSVRAGRLQGGGQARFVVRRRKQELEYRVVLAATSTHGRSASNPVPVPAR